MNPLLLSLVLSTPHVVSVPQDHVLPVFGCGTGCRVETEQLALPERMPDGWWRVKVRQSTWIQKCDWKTSHLACVDEPASGRAGPPIQERWLFANCPRERFATSKNQDRSNTWEQDVFYREGEFSGYPKYQTVHGNPFMRWVKLCPLESRKEKRLIQKQQQFFFKEFFESNKSEAQGIH